MLRFVPEEKLAILEADAGDPQSMTVRMLQVVDAYRTKPLGTRASQLALVAQGRAPPRGLPARVVNVGHGSAVAGEDKFGMPASAVRDHGSSNPVQHDVSVKPVLHVIARNDEDRSAELGDVRLPLPA